MDLLSIAEDHNQPRLGLGALAQLILGHPIQHCPASYPHCGQIASRVVLDLFSLDTLCRRVQLQPHLLLLPSGPWTDPGSDSGLTVRTVMKRVQLCPPGSGAREQHPTMGTLMLSLSPRAAPLALHPGTTVQISRYE